MFHASNVVTEVVIAWSVSVFIAFGLCYCDVWLAGDGKGRFAELGRGLFGYFTARSQGYIDRWKSTDFSMTTQTCPEFCRRANEGVEVDEPQNLNEGGLPRFRVIARDTGTHTAYSCRIPMHTPNISHYPFSGCQCPSSTNPTGLALRPHGTTSSRC